MIPVTQNHSAVGARTASEVPLAASRFGWSSAALPRRGCASVRWPRCRLWTLSTLWC